MPQNYLTSPEVLAPLIVATVIALVCRMLSDSWFHPAALFTSYTAFTMWTTASLPEQFVLSAGLWYIVAASFCFCIGAIVGRRNPVRRLRTYPPMPRITPRLILLFSAFGGVYVGVLFLIYGADTTMVHPWLRIFNAFLYAPIVVAGAYFAFPNARYKWLFALVGVSPLLTVCLVAAGRSGIVLALTILVAAFVATSVVLSGRSFRVFRARFLGGLAAGAALMVVGALWATRTRLIAKNDVLRDELEEGWVLASWEALRTGFSGGVNAFTVWFDFAWDQTPENLDAGLSFFAGPLDLLGLSVRAPMESVEVEVGVYSNVYTVFRPLVDGFTFTGALLVLALLGFLYARLYARALEGYWGSGMWLVIFYNGTLMNGLFFQYNSLALCYLIAGLLAVAVGVRERRRASLVPPPHRALHRSGDYQRSGAVAR